MHAKVWLRHCSQRCHLRTAAWQGWVCLSDIPCSRCPRSWSAAYSPKLYKNVQLWVSKRSKICRTHSFVCVDVELTTPGCVHWRKSTRKSPLSGPILEGHMASCPAQGQITHTNHTSMNYKYCLICACQGMISPLQSKVPPQNNCVTELGVPFQYALFKVSAQLVCSWLP